MEKEKLLRDLKEAEQLKESLTSKALRLKAEGSEQSEMEASFVMWVLKENDFHIEQVKRVLSNLPE